jgi:hypothetical protein
VAVWSKAWVCGRSVAGTDGSNTGAGIDMSVLNAVFSGRGHCVDLITRLKESYRLCVCVCVCV